MQAKELGKQLKSLREDNEAFKALIEYMGEMITLSEMSFRQGNPRVQTPGELEYQQGRLAAVNEILDWMQSIIEEGALEILNDLRQSETDPHEVKITDPDKAIGG